MLLPNQPLPAIHQLNQTDKTSYRTTTTTATATTATTTATTTTGSITNQGRLCELDYLLQHVGAVEDAHVRREPRVSHEEAKKK